MAYTITWKPLGSTIHSKGILCIENIHHHANGEIHGQPDTDSHKYTIWDFSNADLSKKSSDKTIEPAFIDESTSTYIPEFKVAMITSDVHARDLIEDYFKKAQLKIPQRQFKLFENINDAQKWGIT
ncbi:MAG: hypothetical protein K6L73_05295 [Cellvibrionaceae bacterium]